MMKKLYLLLFLMILSSCSEDATFVQDPFVVAFESLSKNLMAVESGTEIALVYSETASENGTANIQITSENAIYGIDFTTTPEAIGGKIVLDINSGESANSITFNKINPFLDETTEIKLAVSSINYSNSNIQGHSEFILNASASLGGSISPEVGGPNQGNQVFVDLSSGATTFAQRNSWDLGFYGGDAFRVAINGSVYMAVAPLDFTDIDAVTESDVSGLKSQVAVGTFDAENAAYIDAPNGNILETAMAEVSDSASENKVYLLNLGYEVGTATPNTGSVAVAGNHRGWKKIRILKNGKDYVLQYADLDASTHQEVTINKTENYNFSFFSFNTNSVVDVEPEKERWDISFTVFTNIIEGAGSYGYSDFVTHNRKGDTEAYMVETTSFEYDAFALSNVDSNLFSKDQTTIGANWRDVFSHTAFSDRFFVVKDPNGNIYKIKFLAMTNDNGERGYPEFQYELLQ
ncbi:HmuY family protein [Tamlana crocina]